MPVMLKAWRDAVTELGHREAVWYVVGRALERALGAPALFRYALVAQPVAGSALPARRGREIEVRILSEPSLELDGIGLEHDTQRYRFAQGALCFGAFHRDALIGCLWICLGPYEEDEVRCRFVPLPPGRASWDLGMYVSPSYRAGLAFARLWDEANAQLRRHGASVTLSRIATGNRRSLASHARLGARRIGTATFFCLGRAQVMIATVRPYLHVSLSPARRPLLRLFVDEPAAVTEDSPPPLG
jgi:hypothetical protein